MLRESGVKMITIENKKEEQGQQVGFDTVYANIHNNKVRQFIIQNVLPKIDILIESFRPGVMERLELGPTEVHEINPNLIYVRVSGFGHAGNH